MKIIRVIAEVAILYVFYLAGDVLQKLLHLPVPGSIVGLLLLFVLLLLKIVPVKLIENGSSFILAYLPMFFIPATAGIMNHLDIFSGRGCCSLRFWLSAAYSPWLLLPIPASGLPASVQAVPADRPCLLKV